MGILKILRKQEEILFKLNQALMEEKSALIHNDGEALRLLVEQKIGLLDELNEQEDLLKEQTKGRKISELTHEEVSFELINPVIKSIETLTQEIKGYQEINMLLTMQSIGYANKMMQTIKKAIEKSSNMYNKAGIYKQNEKINVAAIDKTV